MKVTNILKFDTTIQAYNYAMANEIRLDQENEKLITLLEPWQVYYYAQDIVGSRFELGEPLIAKSADFSFNYARFILKSRFRLGEKALRKSPRFSCYYAIYVLKSRFKLGERAIVKNNNCCVKYIKEILKYHIPIDFLEKCSIKTLEKIIDKCQNKEDVIKVLFKKKILSND